MASASPLFCRADSASRGRHLRACQNIEKGRLIFAERPLLALQSLDNTRPAWICHHCKAFVGDPDTALLRRFQKEMDFSSYSATDNIILCRRDCGHVYCSVDCEQDAWAAHHRFLCTGDCDDNSHPLVQFKQFSVETNEILLLVAEWWVAEHTTADEDCTKKYGDFRMEPWWDVVMADLVNQPGGFAEAAALQQSLRQICQDAAALLQKALPADEIPPVTALDIGRRIGACEQNAIGIRQRHPLCRDVFDTEFRQRRHTLIVRCLEEAGFIRKDTDKDDEGEKSDDGDGCEEAKLNSGKGNKETVIFNGNSSAPADVRNSAEETEAAGAAGGIQDPEEEWDYSVDEIASFLSSLFLDEDGLVRDTSIDVMDHKERDTQGDDFDYIFPPLDGTAMYATACKMNHACDPNVIVLYKRTGWGSRHPLTAYCCAFKPIADGEELTISYVDVDQSLQQRQAALSNYGFTCSCSRCEQEKDGCDAEPAGIVQESEEDALFGEDDEVSSEEENREKSSRGDGEAKLQQRLERLDSAANHSMFGSTPLTCLAPVSAFVVQTASVTVCELSDDVLNGLLQQCVEGIRERDFCLCKIVGCDLEATLYSILRKESSWPSLHYREAYWCSVLTTAIGHAHGCDFLGALAAMDKGLILGLARDEQRIGIFFSYVEAHASQIVIRPYPPAILSMIADCRAPEIARLIQIVGLSQPIRFPVAELDDRPTPEVFQSDYVSISKPIVLRKFGSEWLAVTKWRDLRLFARDHGHRIVPIELGSMLSGGIKEELMPLRSFIGLYLVSSTAKNCWSLQEAVDPSFRVAYLAQHPLLSQIPMLQEDLDMNPQLCGRDGPTHVCLWMGTGGTRTPLHFDSYDNLFVQVIGAKYVRLYSKEESSKLYISNRSGLGLQGNMSEISCENEHWDRHPLAQSASYTEVLLFPGDCIFIPARTWHYVRSLSTSISVNYWF